MDLVLQIGGYTFSQHSKRNLLYSVATTQSMMDYLPKAIKDRVVDNHPSRGIPVAMNFPSSLQGKAMVELSKSKW